MATQSDIENVFGQENVRRWSNLTSTATTVDTARVAQALAIAARQVDDCFRHQAHYTLPLPTDDPIVTNWVATKAGYWLFRSRASGAGDAGDAYAGLIADVDREISQYTSGAKKLTAPTTTNGPTAPYAFMG